MQFPCIYKHTIKFKTTEHIICSFSISWISKSQRFITEYSKSFFKAPKHRNIWDNDAMEQV